MAHGKSRSLLVHLLVSTGIFLVGLIVVPRVFAQQVSTPDELYFTWAYVLGTACALGYKMGIGTLKRLQEKRFRWAKLLWPSFVSFLLSVPLIFVVMPKFGRPTGSFTTDIIYAYLTTYTLVDMTSDLFTVREIISEMISRATDEDEV